MTLFGLKKTSTTTLAGGEKKFDMTQYPSEKDNQTKITYKNSIKIHTWIQSAEIREIGVHFGEVPVM